MMDRAKFYAALRKRGSGVFGTSLSQAQVKGMEGILNEAEKRKTPLKWLAYMLSTTYHETAHTMQPIRERGGPKYFRRYEGRGDLGNLRAGDGVKFHGRGFVQITGRRNYADWTNRIDIDLINNPDRALELGIATQILFDGMEFGTFTGKRLSDYTDYAPMRRIINGMDRASDLAGYAVAFEKALREAGYGQWPQPKPVAPVVLQKQPPVTDKPVSVTQTADNPHWLAALMAAIAKLFKRT